MNKRHYEHTLPNIRGSLSNTYTYGPSWSFHDFGRLPVEERVLLDYVFVTKSAKIDRYRVIQDKPENSYLSDHCPILVELTVQ